MKTRFLLLLGLICFFVAPALSQDLLNGQGRFWRLDKAGLPPSYLFGTIHIPDPRVTDLPPAVEEAMRQSRQFIFELVHDADTDRRVAVRMALPPSQNLQNILPPKLFANTVAYARRYGLPEAQVRRFKPWALVLVFALTPEQLAQMAQGGVPLDLKLQQIAASLGGGLNAFETIDGQLDVFDTMALEDQVRLLSSTVRLADRQQTLMRDMIANYLKGDLSAIYALMETQLDPEGQAFADLFKQKLLNDRNRQMARVAADFLPEGRVFIAVGALHLPGELGLVNLLRQQGYTATRIELAQ